MEQLALLADVQRVERPWKRTTSTSRQAIREVEASGDADLRRRHVLKAIRAIWNRTQQSPTADEIAAYLFKRKRIPGDHPDYVKPRLCELDRGYYRWIKVDGERRRVHLGGGLIEKAGKRKSSRSGKTVHTWRAIEIGTGPSLQHFWN